MKGACLGRISHLVGHLLIRLVSIHPQLVDLKSKKYWYSKNFGTLWVGVVELFLISPGPNFILAQYFTCLKKDLIEEVSPSINVFRNSIEFSFPSYFVKFANVCKVFAISVKFRLALSPGNSSVKLNNDGASIAGQIYRRNIQEEIKLSPTSGLPTCCRYCLIL